MTFEATAESFLRRLDGPSLRAFRMREVLDAYLTMGALPSEARPTSWERLHFAAGPVSELGNPGLQIAFYRDLEVPEDDMVSENPWSIGIVARFDAVTATGHADAEAQSPAARQGDDETLLELELFAERIRAYLDAAGLTEAVPDAITVVVSSDM